MQILLTIGAVWLALAPLAAVAIARIAPRLNRRPPGSGQRPEQDVAASQHYIHGYR